MLPPKPNIFLHPTPNFFSIPWQKMFFPTKNKFSLESHAPKILPPHQPSQDLLLQYSQKFSTLPIKYSPHTQNTFATLPPKCFYTLSKKLFLSPIPLKIFATPPIKNFAPPAPEISKFSNQCVTWIAGL